MTQYPDDADGAVLADLEASGINMSEPLLIEFAVAVPDEDAATHVHAALSEAGYESLIAFDEGELDDSEDDEELDPEEFGPSWTVYANVVMIPKYAEIIRIQAELDRLAGPWEGFSDGWGVLVDDDEA